MATATTNLRKILTDSLDVARQLGAEFEYQLTGSADMESETTHATVRFVEGRASDSSLNVRLLLDQLDAATVVAAIDLFPPPKARLVIHGALRNRNYRIVICLNSTESTAEQGAGTTG